MRLILLLTAAALLPAAAHAEAFQFSSSDGPLYVEVSPSGHVAGRYPRKNGALYGRMTEDRTVTGIWIQPRSDQPCPTAQQGSYYWGRFMLTNPYARPVYGMWGYCGEKPDRSWDIRRF